jgi:ketosteroid isomerase-like protein
VSPRAFFPAFAVALGVLTGCSAVVPGAGGATDLRAQVMAAERAFAKTMADRDLKAFATHIADEAIFFAGNTPLRGKQKVVDDWSKFFAGPQPPFSWEPDLVEVLDSGTLALSSGPVRDPSGKVVARFNSIWRLDASGRWLVVFDKGSPAQ